MKRKLLSILLLIALLISFSAPLGMQAANKTIKLNKAKAVLEVDARITLKLGDISATEIKWSSSAKKIASVTSKGVVTAKSEGDATITATYNKKKYTCKVMVVNSNNEEAEKDFSSIEEYLLAQQDSIEAVIKEQEDAGMNMEVFAEDNILVYRYTYQNEMPISSEVKEYFNESFKESEDQFMAVIEEMKRLIGVRNPKVKLIYQNPDGTIIYECTFPK